MPPNVVVPWKCCRTRTFSDSPTIQGFLQETQAKMRGDSVAGLSGSAPSRASLVPPTKNSCMPKTRTGCDCLRGQKLPSLVDGPPDATRWEGDFCHSRGYGSPAANINCDHFAARMPAHVPLGQGTYEFTIVSDDGVRMCIDSLRVLDAWKRQDNGRHTFQRTLSHGVHIIEIHYFKARGGAYLCVAWAQRRPPRT